MLPDVFVLGPMMMDATVITYLLSFLVGFFIMKLRLNRTQYASPAFVDLLMNNLLILALFWKFGTLLFEPSIVWRKPLHILAMRGDWKELLLGVVVAFIYSRYKLRKLNIPMAALFELIPFGILSASMLQSILIWNYGKPTSMFWGISLNAPELNYHPIHGYVFLLSAVMFIWLWHKAARGGKVLQDFLIYYGIGMWIITYFKLSQPLIWLFSSDQLLYTLMIVLGAVFPYIIRGERS